MSVRGTNEKISRLPVGIGVNGENQVAVVQAYILCTMEGAFPYQVTFGEAISIDEPTPIHTRYTLQISSWTEANGVLRRWKFGFGFGLIYRIWEEVLDVGVGDYQGVLNAPYPTKGLVDEYQLRW